MTRPSIVITLTYHQRGYATSYILLTVRLSLSCGSQFVEQRRSTWNDWMDGTAIMGSTILPCFVSGIIVKGFGRGSKALGIPTGILRPPRTPLRIEHVSNPRNSRTRRVSIVTFQYRQLTVRHFSLLKNDRERSLRACFFF